MAQAGIIESVLTLHAEEASFLWEQRNRLVGAAHIRLEGLARHDERIAAHLDGVSESEFGTQQCLALGEPGGLFAAAVCALEAQSAERFAELVRSADSEPALRGPLVAACGWVAPARLRGVVARLLESSCAAANHIGVGASAAHRVDCGTRLVAAIESSDAALRARALRAAGELGRQDLRPATVAAIESEDASCRFWAAWSSVLLGDRGRGIEALEQLARSPGPFRRHALQTAALALEPAPLLELLRALRGDEQVDRLILLGVGLSGNPRFVPWLIDQMDSPRLSRLCGEAFARITGVDLPYSRLEREAPPDEADEASADESEDVVPVHEDEDLAWPDAQRVRAWWAANAYRFTPDTRYLLGQPLTRESCRSILRDGYQRQRIMAAHHLVLLEPGAVLFEWRAPAWRQQRLLAGG